MQDALRRPRRIRVRPLHCVAFFCPACAPIVREKQRRVREDLDRRLLDAQWLTLCPSEFLAVDHRLLPDSNLFDRVQIGAAGRAAW